MTFLLIVSLLSMGIPSGDGAIVMLPGIPVNPWGALSNDQLEEMWTYGIEGYQVTRSGWSGYILSGPSGSAVVLEELAESLEGDSLMPDSSLWARTLQLVWNTNALASSWILSDSTPNPPVVPVRSSRWLEAGADTLILSLPVDNSVFLWSGERSSDFNLPAWRGIGTEVVPAGAASINALVTFSIEGSPEDVISLAYTPSELDDFWEEEWAPLLNCADSLVARQMSGDLQSQNSLIWIRGSGGENFCPWTFVPSPSPLAVASVEVERISSIIASINTRLAPGAVSVQMPGNAGSGARAAYAAALLERIVSRMALPYGTFCKGVSFEDGSVALYLSGVDWDEPTALANIRSELSPVVFTSPEHELLNNAAVRAGIPEMSQQETIALLALVTGF